jgi:hypothetical protein
MHVHNLRGSMPIMESFFLLCSYDLGIFFAAFSQGQMAIADYAASPINQSDSPKVMLFAKFT